MGRKATPTSEDVGLFSSFALNKCNWACRFRSGAREGRHGEVANEEGEEAQRSQQSVWKGQLRSSHPSAVYIPKLRSAGLHGLGCLEGR